MNSNNLKFHVDDLDEIIDGNIIPGEIREEKRSRQSTKSPRPGSTSDSEKKRSASRSRSRSRSKKSTSSKSRSNLRSRSGSKSGAGAVPNEGVQPDLGVAPAPDQGARPDLGVAPAPDQSQAANLEQGAVAGAAPDQKVRPDLEVAPSPDRGARPVPRQDPEASLGAGPDHPQQAVPQLLPLVLLTNTYHLMTSTGLSLDGRVSLRTTDTLCMPWWATTWVRRGWMMMKVCYTAWKTFYTLSSQQTQALPDMGISTTRVPRLLLLFMMMLCMVLMILLQKL